MEYSSNTLSLKFILIFKTKQDLTVFTVQFYTAYRLAVTPILIRNLAGQALDRHNSLISAKHMGGHTMHMELIFD